MPNQFHDRLKKLIDEYIFWGFQSLDKFPKHELYGMRSHYIFYLGQRLAYISPTEYKELFSRKEEIAKMLWSSMEGMRNDKEKD